MKKLVEKCLSFSDLFLSVLLLADYVHCLNKGSDNVALFQALILKN